MLDKTTHPSQETKPEHMVDPTPTLRPTFSTKKAPKAFYAMMGTLGAILVVVLCTGIVPRIMTNRELEAEHAAIVNGIPEVSVIPVHAASHEQELVLPANVEPIQEIAVHSRIDGYLKERLVDIGDHVKEKQLLAIIDSPETIKELEQAKADLRQAKAQVKSSQSDLEQANATLITNKANVKNIEANLRYSTKEVARYQQLAKQGAVSFEQGDQAQRNVEADRASLEAARASVKAAESQESSFQEKLEVAKASVDSKEANLERMETLASFQKVLAPCSGVITARDVDAGALISSGSNSNVSDLMKLARTDTLRVHIFVPQSFYQYVHEGMPTEIQVTEFPNEHFTGNVARIAGGLDSATRTLRAEIHIPNADGRLMPGMYVRVKLIAHRDDPPVIIPSNALVVRNDGEYVVVVQPNNVCQYRKVCLSNDYGHDVEVTKGLNDGDRVILDPPIDLPDHQTVKPVLKVEAAPAH